MWYRREASNLRLHILRRQHFRCTQQQWFLIYMHRQSGCFGNISGPTYHGPPWYWYATTIKIQCSHNRLNNLTNRYQIRLTLGGKVRTAFEVNTVWKPEPVLISSPNAVSIWSKTMKTVWTKNLLCAKCPSIWVRAVLFNTLACAIIWSSIGL